MKLTNIHLIIILVLALILCPVLGVCYSTREGFNVNENMDMDMNMDMDNQEKNKSKNKEQTYGYDGPNFGE